MGEHGLERLGRDPVAATERIAQRHDDEQHEHARAANVRTGQMRYFDSRHAGQGGKSREGPALRQRHHHARKAAAPHAAGRVVLDENTDAVAREIKEVFAK